MCYEARSMSGQAEEHYDFFMSRRGSVANIAREVAEVLVENGYKVFVQDYDIAITGNFIEEMHEAIKNSRDLIVLFTSDYETSPYTRMEFTSFEANAAQSREQRRMVILRCDEAPLLGLFAPHVYQDLVGVSNAEDRKSRILAAVEGRSQTIPPPPRPFIGIPARIASFTGRTNELDRLDAILVKQKPAAVTQSVGRAAIQGLGGIGKTTLSVEYAHRFRGLYAGVCWCPAGTRAQLLSGLANLAVVLGAAAPAEPDIEKAAKVALRRLAEQRTTWLLVYDNVTSPKDVADLLPSAGARLLITSRFADWSEWAEEVPLDVLPLEEATILLQKRAGRSDPAGAIRLSEALGRLPLALDHAGAYCRLTNASFDNYRERISILVARIPPGTAYPASVAATFGIAIEEAAGECPAARTLLAHIACLAPDHIPTSLITEDILPEDARSEALLALTAVSLIEHTTNEPAINVHRLVQLVMRSSLGSEAGPIIETLTRNLAHAFPPGTYYEPNAWAVCAGLLPHVFALHGQQVWNKARAVDVIKLLDSTANHLSGRERSDDAEELLRAAISIGERTIGRNNRLMASCLNDLGGLLANSGRRAEAEGSVRDALAAFETVGGRNDREFATCLGNLANVLAVDHKTLSTRASLVISSRSLSGNRHGSCRG
jgi:tetratricopeptide (TPR) repeat protein